MQPDWPDAQRSTTLARPLHPTVRAGVASLLLLITPGTPVRELSGRITNLARFRGRVVVVKFWATWCPSCVYEMPSLDLLARTSGPHHLAVLAISR